MTLISDATDPIYHTENWFAVYTKPRTEKKFKDLLDRFSIENYLPLLKVKKKWSDRMKVIETPLFTSYIFVKIIYWQDYKKVISLPQSVAFVSSYGRLAVVPEDEIHLIQSLVSEYPDRLKAMEKEMLQKGNEVVIKSGPFAGKTAVVQKLKNETYVLLEIKSIEKVIRVELKKEDILLEPISF